MPARELTETKRAIEDVDKGMPVKEAAQKWGLDPSSLYRAIKRRSSQSDNPRKK